MFQTAFYFGYMAMFAAGLGIMCGTYRFVCGRRCVYPWLSLAILATCMSPFIFVSMGPYTYLIIALTDTLLSFFYRELWIQRREPVCKSNIQEP